MVRRLAVLAAAVLLTAAAGLTPGAAAPEDQPSPAAPSTPPAATPPATTPSPPAASPPVASPQAPSLPGDAFGQEVTLPEKTILYFSGNGLWDSAFESILDGFKTVYAYLDKQGVKPAGMPLVIYTQTDDSGFAFHAAVPIEAAPANPPQGDLAVGKSPSGKAYKFVHHGSYDAMDSTYDSITNFLDEKALDAQDLFVEEYVTDPVKTAEDQLVINVYVPVK